MMNQVKQIASNILRIFHIQYKEYKIHRTTDLLGELTFFAGIRRTMQ
jgi:hypothetical protein